MKVNLIKNANVRGVDIYLNEQYAGSEIVPSRIYEKIFPEHDPSNSISRMIEAPKKKATITPDDEDMFSGGGEFEDEGMSDLDTEEDDEIPVEFYFESFMIFISNYMDVPTALADRVTCIRYVYTKEQATDLIETQLADLVPSLTMTQKKEVLKFLRSYLKYAPRVSFRLYKTLCSVYASGNPEWKRWALLQMRNLPG